MLDFFVPEYTLMDFDFWEQVKIEEHFHRNIEILYVLDGSGEIYVNDKAYALRQDDFILINENVKHSFISHKKAILGCIHINYVLLNKYLDLHKYLFECNVSQEHNENTDKCKVLIKQIFSMYFEKKSLRVFELNMRYYDLQNMLIEHFMVEKSHSSRYGETTEVAERKLEVVNYIYENFHNQISLKDLANHLFLTEAYLSRYIKKELGMNYTDFVNHIRLQHAINELVTTSKGITSVALDNGFPSTASFNKQFKKTYHMTPSDYLSSLTARENKTELLLKPRQMELSMKTKQYLEEFKGMGADLGWKKKVIKADIFKRTQYNKNWNKVINMGRLVDFLRSDVQEHMLILKKELEFEYVRFWDIYSSEFFLNTGTKDRLNFRKMDRAFDFLHDNGIKPYIELGFKPKRLVKNLDDFILSEEQEVIFKTPDEIKEFLSQLMEHYVNRYGLEEVEQWYFEQWYDPRIKAYGNGLYFEIFAGIYKSIKSISPNIKIGGAGFEYYLELEEVRKVISLWKNQLCLPDFISIYCYPYMRMEVDKNERRVVDADFARARFEEIQKIVMEEGLRVHQIHITEWNFSVSNRNSLHDSCFKGSYILKNLISNIGKADFIGYWSGSDLFSEYNDIESILMGATGLLTRDAIKKPAFWAYQFMNRLSRFLIYKDENILITTNGREEYFIVCHNYKQINKQYYRKVESAFLSTEHHKLFYDFEPIQLNIELEYVKQGQYQIKTRCVNQDYGSVEDEWIRLGRVGNLTNADLDYLRNSCVPRISIRVVHTQGDLLSFSTILKAHEIQYIHISYQI